VDLDCLSLQYFLAHTLSFMLSKVLYHWSGLPSYIVVAFLLRKLELLLEELGNILWVLVMTVSGNQGVTVPVLCNYLSIFIFVTSFVTFFVTAL
jgi:hypothetical protein